MTDRDDRLRKIASVRRDLEDLEDEVSTAEGAMPKHDDPADGGRHNFLMVLKRLESIRDMADETAEKLRSVLKGLD